MAATKRSEREMQMKYQKKMASCDDPLELLRSACLSRGANGIKGLARTFKIMDDDRSKSLDLDEFTKGIHDYGIVQMDKNQCQTLFSKFDKDGSGTIDFDEFLVHLRPPMNNSRKTLIAKAFQKADKTGDGFITVEDLEGVYKVDKHPKYISGEYTKEQVLRIFLDAFDSTNDKDGQITKEEFDNYYAGVSASIDNDAYFDLVMRNAWKL